MVLFVLGVVVKQGNMIQRELWLIQRSQLGRARESIFSPAEHESRLEER
jgi:hypothetical protein